MQFWLPFILMILLYAVIPFIPALFLRIKFPESAKWIAIISTIFGTICLLMDFIYYLGGLRTLSQFILYTSYFVPCSIPALYCLAFFDKGRKIWLALIPAAAYFLHWFIQYCTFLGFYGTLGALIAGIPGDQSKTLTDMCFVFEIWALFCVLITRKIAKIIARNKIKDI